MRCARRAISAGSARRACAIDVVRLTVEQHREHREVVVVELRDRCLEYVARDRWHHDFSVGDPADRSEQRRDGLGLVDDAVGLRGTSRDGQGGTRDTPSR